MDNRLSDWQRLRQRVLSVEQVRAVDRLAVERYAMHSLVLMENAARSCVEWLERNFPTPLNGQQRSLVALCGKGNNGGDGLAIARHAEYLGWNCSVFVAGERESLSSDARANAEILAAGPAPTEIVFGWDARYQTILDDRLAAAHVVLDAMLGTGVEGAPRPPFDEWIERANRSAGKRVAIDMPTGVNAITGDISPGGYFKADATLTFVALKPAMQLPQSNALFGEIDVMSIGIPLSLIKFLLGDR